MSNATSKAKNNCKEVGENNSQRGEIIIHGEGRPSFSVLYYNPSTWWKKESSSCYAKILPRFLFPQVANSIMLLRGKMYKGYKVGKYYSLDEDYSYERRKNNSRIVWKTTNCARLVSVYSPSDRD